MKIVQIAAIEEPVPTKKYGGVELVVHNLTEELVKRGHEVYLIAAGTSKTKANLIPLIPKSLRETFSTEEIGKWRDYYKMYYIGQVLKEIKKINPDVVHNHLNWRFLLFSDLIDQPMVSTIHGPISTFNERETYQRFLNENYISISDNQRKAMPNLNWLKTVYNGIDLSKFDYQEQKGDYFTFLGRTSPEKGLAEIVKMIRQTKHKLKIAAKVDAVDVEYFEKQVMPYVDGEQIQFLGEVDHKGKNELLKNSKGLLLWLNWEEPFGLVVVEAMATGTPVIATNRGSMKELIQDKKTGYLVKTIDEMKKRLDDVGKINPKDCRDHVVNNFSKEKMVDGYEECYRQLMNQKIKLPNKRLIANVKNSSFPLLTLE